MKKQFRIKKTKEIDALFKQQKRVANKYFSVFYLESNQTFRFAISIGRKYGNAVERNLMKRRIREIIRLYQSQIKDFDFVIVVRPEAIKLSFQQIKININELLTKVNVMEENK